MESRSRLLGPGAYSLQGAIVNASRAGVDRAVTENDRNNTWTGDGSTVYRATLGRAQRRRRYKKRFDRTTSDSTQVRSIHAASSQRDRPTRRQKID